MKKFNDFLDFKFNLIDCFLKSPKAFYLTIAILILLLGLIYFIISPLFGLLIIIITETIWRILCEILYFVAPQSKDYIKKEE